MKNEEKLTQSKIEEFKALFSEEEYIQPVGEKHTVELAELAMREISTLKEKDYNKNQHRISPTIVEEKKYLKNSRDPISTLFASRIDSSPLSEEEAETLGLKDTKKRIAESKEMLAIAKDFAKNVLKLKAPVFEWEQGTLKRTNTLVVGGPVAELNTREGDSLVQNNNNAYDLDDLSSSLALVKDVLENVLNVQAVFNTKEDMRVIEERNLADIAMDEEDRGGNVDIQDDRAFVSRGYSYENQSKVYAPDFVLDNISDGAYFDPSIYTSYEKSLDLPTNYRDSELGVKNGELEFPVHGANVRNTYHVASVLSALVRAYEAKEHTHIIDRFENYNKASDAAVKLFSAPELYTNEYDSFKITGNMIVSYLKSTGLYEGLLKTRGKTERDMAVEYYNYCDINNKIGRLNFEKTIDFRNRFTEMDSDRKRMQASLPFKDFVEFVCPKMDVVDYIIHSTVKDYNRNGSYYIPQEKALSAEKVFEEYCKHIANGEKMEPVGFYATTISRNGEAKAYVPIYGDEFKSISEYMDKCANTVMKKQFYDNCLTPEEAQEKEVAVPEIYQRMLKQFSMQLKNVTEKEMKAVLEWHGVKKILFAFDREDTNPETRKKDKCNIISADVIKSIASPILKLEKNRLKDKGRYLGR